MYDYLIVGAGLFGATFAQQAKLNKKKCLVIDKRDHIGGNVFTSLDAESGILVHRYGAHIFHTSNDIVWEYVNKFCKFDNFVNSPIAIYKDQVFNLPFNMNTFNRLWGVVSPKQAMDQIIAQVRQFGVSDPKNLEEQAISLVGVDIYHKLIKGYTEKQWGKSCCQLPASIIKRLPLRFCYDNNYFNDTYQGIPQGGYTQMVQSMLDGVRVELQTDYFKYFHKKENKIAKKIVYTGMIDKFFDYCYGKLEYRSLRFENKLMLGTENFQGVPVVNYTDIDVPFTRIIEHRHFSPKAHDGNPNTFVSYEYPQDFGEYNEAFYPINDVHNTSIANKYELLTHSLPNVIFGGRLAEYKYYDMDKVIARAILAVKTEFNVMIN